MKLFYFDNRHSQILANLDLGELSPNEFLLLHKVLQFLKDEKVIDGRYKDLELAESAEIVYEDGEAEIVFRGIR
jgi:hypothetical protein